MPPVRFDAVLLAAGLSTRMGRDKALLEIGGGPLWRRQRAVLTEAGAVGIFLSARADQPWVREAAPEFAGVVADEVPDAGPLAGIAAALARMRASHIAVLAIDLPAMEARWFRLIAARCAPGLGAVGRRGEFFEPLAAIYPRELLPAARAALRRGELSLQQLIAGAVAEGRMRSAEIAREDAVMFRNWNEGGAEL